jgi:hypothetical protein
MVIKYCKLDDINDMIYNYIKNTDFKINGIIFMPFISGK